MSADVIQLPTSQSVEQAWETYCALVQAQDADRSLLANQDHQIAIVRSWKAWRDLFLAWAA